MPIKTLMPSLKNYLLFLSVLFTVLSISQFSLSYLGLTLSFNGIFDSDAAFLAVLTEDILRRSGDIRNWHLAHVLFLFPDFLLYLFLSLFSPSTFWVSYAFLIGQIIICIWATAYFLSSFIHQILAIFFATLSTLFTLQLGLNLLSPFDLSFTIVNHFGAYILLLLEMGLFFRILQSNDLSPKKSALFFSLILIANLSDKLLLLHFILPAGAICLYQYLHDQMSLAKFKKMLFIMALATIGSMVIIKLLITNAAHPSASLGLDNAKNSFTNIINHFNASAFKNSPIFWIIPGTYLVILGVLFIGHGPKHVFLNTYQRISLPSQFFLFLSGFTLLVVIFSNWGFAPRYAIPIFLLPIVLILPISYILSKRQIPAINTVLAIIGSVIVLQGIHQQYQGYQSTQLHTDFYPPEMLCIDTFIQEKSLKHGIAGYWTAKKFQALSKQSITLAQYQRPFLTRDYWETNATFFRPNYQFAITSDADPQGNSIDTNFLKIKNPALKMHDCKPYFLYYVDDFQLKVN